jgi:hypothetical protein
MIITVIYVHMILSLLVEKLNVELTKRIVAHCCSNFVSNLDTTFSRKIAVTHEQKLHHIEGYFSSIEFPRYAFTSWNWDVEE